MKAGNQDRRFRVAVLLFFLTSGATSLVLEVVWTRNLEVVFGNTVLAASTVLTAFMLGLALGAAVLGRLADRSHRPLVLYGCLEIGVGVYALLFPLLVAASYAAYSWFFRTADAGVVLLGAVRFALSLAMLLPPTFLMGGTLPVLGRYLGVGHGNPGQAVGYLYGANTAGAVAGCFLAGFVLLEAVGVHGSLMVAAAAAITIGVLAVGLGYIGQAAAAPELATLPEALPARPPRKEKRRSRGHATAFAESAQVHPRRPQPTESLTPGAFRLVLVAFGIAGFCSLAYEVLWTRVLVFVLSTTVYSFATMLTTFLAGLALGSLLASRFLVPRIRQPLLWLGVVEVLVGLTALVSLPLLSRLDAIDCRFARWFAWSGQWHLMLSQFADAFVVLLAPTLLMGAAFPLVTTCCLRGDERVGRRVGQIYAANTIGCVLGSFSAGFVLLATLGTHHSLLVIVALNFTIGVVLVGWASPRSGAARLALAAPLAAVAVASFLLTPADIFYDTLNAYHKPSRLTFVREHSTGTVTVHDLPNGDRLLASSGINVAGLDFMLRSTQKLQGYIPLCLHPNPKRVVQIGFGSGETARTGRVMGIEDYTVVEICPAIFEAGKYFEAINGGAYRDPRIRKVIMDGKNFALLSREKFDVIMNDSVYPGSSGGASLYTADHFRNCRERLNEGGLLSCWVPLDLRPAELRMILKSFQESFPHTSLWIASNCLNKHALILGSVAPLRIDLVRLEAVVRRPEVLADLKAIEIHDAYDLLDCLMCDEDAVRKLVASDPLNTDDRPRLEFSCARQRDPDATLGQTLSELARHRTPVTPYVVFGRDAKGTRAELARRFEATSNIFLAQAAQMMGFPKERRRLLDLAAKVNPGECHGRSCDLELTLEIRDLYGAVGVDERSEGPRRQRQLQELRQDLVEHVGNRALALRLAEKLYDGLRYEEAAGVYRVVISLPPSPADAFVRLADIEFGTNGPDAAIEVLQRCLAAWPDSATAHDRLAGIYLKLGRLDVARSHISEAVSLEPDNPLFAAHHQRIVAQGLTSARAN
ncbi:MAG: fused MFS/spermidine synthase [Pirellulales bacterium]